MFLLNACCYIVAVLYNRPELIYHLITKSEAPFINPIFPGLNVIMQSQATLIAAIRLKQLDSEVIFNVQRRTVWYVGSTY